MAILPKEVPVTRSQVAGWLADWQAMSKDTRPSIQLYIGQQVDALNLPDTMVNTVGMSNLGDETPIADMILDDLPSYGFDDTST